MITARLFYCALCDTQVIICSKCDRGNIYCGDECARLARLESSRAAGKRYQESYKGRLNHAARQQQYRQRQQKKMAEKNIKIKKVTHQGSQQNSSHVPLSQELVEPKNDKLHCHFCQKPVSKFLRKCFLGGLVDNLSPIDNYLARAP